jgi:putative tryptophan/tyrosine transport system substrate-binding protein
VVRAQRSERMRRIGVLMGFPEDDPLTKARLAVFQQGLDRLGWLEGRNVRIDLRFAPAGAQAQVLAKELVALQPDVILAISTPIVSALQQTTRTVPIVFVTVADPIGSGFVATLARPGGNITGLLLFEESITGKWLALLKDITPRLARAALVINPKTPPIMISTCARPGPRLRRSRSSLSSVRSRTLRPTSSAPSSRLRACRTAAWSCHRIPRP